MELRHLSYFTVLAKEMNFRKAAERLNISQPPLSRQIDALERELGVALTRRKGRTSELTPAGEFFRGEAEKLLAAAAALARRTSLFADGEAPRPLRIGCIGSLMFTFFPEFIAGLRRGAADARIEIEEIGTENQEEAILDGRIDLGFLRAWVSREGIKYDPLGEERLSLLYPLAMAPEGSGLASFSRLPFIKGTAPGLGERIVEICRKAGFEPNTTIECSQFASLLKLVSAGVGWTIVPEPALSRIVLEGTAATPLPDTVEFGVAYREGPVPERMAAAIRAAKLFVGEKARAENVPELI